jgi:hypothetical protein
LQRGIEPPWPWVVEAQVADHRAAAVGGRVGGHLVQPRRRERLDQPPRGALALLGRELVGVGDRAAGDQRRQVLLGAGHQLPHLGAQLFLSILAAVE